MRIYRAKLVLVNETLGASSKLIATMLKLDRSTRPLSLSYSAAAQPEANAPKTKTKISLEVFIVLSPCRIVSV
tara:strand:+ start:5912 stop:6130 length:219 start_codon:yes stop_codon:yes gene_type:complete